MLRLILVLWFLSFSGVVVVSWPSRPEVTHPASRATSRVVAETGPVSAPDTTPRAIDVALTDYLTWVAGTSTADSSESYRRFAAASAEAYAILRQTKLDSLAAFRDLHLAAVRQARTVLYPFAGGDAIYPTELFPQADTIILFGLEPIGRVFDWRQRTIAERADFLSKLSTAVTSSNRAGFFFTLDMGTQFADSTLDGVLHPLLMYLGWRGQVVVSATRFDPQTPSVDRPGDRVARGIRLVTRPATARRETVVEYIRTDLSDVTLARDSALVAYLRQWHDPVVYLKAASYLLHNAGFSVVRQTLLSEATAVVQDDTGFPLTFLTERFGSVQVFGRYDRTIEIFKDRFQPDLRALYERPGVPPLNLRMGYGGRPNLQYATGPVGEAPDP